MITVLTKLTGKNEGSAKELREILNQLRQETSREKGLINYEVFSVNNDLNSFYIFEKWENENDLNNHIETISINGYASNAEKLISNKLENILLTKLI